MHVTVCVFKTDAEKTFPSLVRVSVTNTSPEDLNTGMEGCGGLELLINVK